MTLSRNDDEKPCNKRSRVTKAVGQSHCGKPYQLNRFLSSKIRNDGVPRSLWNDCGAHTSHRPVSITICHYHVETFHMVNNSDPKIVSWDSSGESFIVLNIEEFEEVRCNREAVEAD